MFPEAEYAFRQAIDLYPLSPEAISAWRTSSCSSAGSATRASSSRRSSRRSGNDKVAEFLKQIKDTEAADARRVELEGQFSQGRGELNAAIELAGLYRKLNMEGSSRASPAAS